MKILVTIEGDLNKMMNREVRAAERAVTLGIQSAGAALQADWRADITTANLGKGLANSIRKKNFPNRAYSIGAASLVYSNASKVVDAFDRGVVIRSKNGLYLAIPTEKAGKKGQGNKRITPDGWERRTGKRLTFVFRKPGPSFLVDRGQKEFRTRNDPLSYTNPAQRKGIKRKPVVIFILVPQVKLPKRLNLDAATAKAEASLPRRILANWPDKET